MAKKKSVKIVVQPQNKNKNKKKVKQQELTRLGKALRALGGLGGASVGGLIGMPSSGAAVGSGLGAALSRWLGSGDYQVSANSMVSSMKASGSIPMMHKNDQTVVVRHKEFIGEIRSSINYAVRYSLELNPGVEQTFPWLSNIARNYQEYRFKGVIFHYVPTSGSAIASTNNALGSVMLQTSYRATDSAPDTKRELLNEYWSTETSPAETTCHPIECNPAENPFNVQYVRQTDIPAGDNLLLYDLGRTYVAVSGQQANDVVLGDLWVTYEVELKKPVLYSNVTNSLGNLISYDTAFGTGVKSGTFFDDTTIVTRYAGTVIPTVSGRTITIPSNFEGYIGVFLRISANSPYIDTGAAGFAWDSSMVTTGPVTAAALCGGSSRWGTVVDTPNIPVRGVFQAHGYLKRNTDGALPATLTFSNPSFAAGGATLFRCQMTIMLTYQSS